MKILSYRQITFWLAIAISAVAANFWAYWGIIENFHEGWYYEHLWNNIVLMFGQYLLMPLGFIIISAISIKWHKIGALLFLLVAIGSYFLFGKLNAGFLLISTPLILLGLLYWFGESKHHKLAYILVDWLPLLLIICIGSYFLVRVSGRYNDHNFGIRDIKGNGINLIWAPQGPGWPDKGTSWYDAKYICAHLNSDGTKLEKTTVNIWRLPTVDEAVRSMVIHGKNAGGVWDLKDKKATYNTQPDKESPLWNSHLQTIYWWTSTETNSSNAYIIVYNGGVWPRQKKLKADYLNFRAVKKAN